MNDIKLIYTTFSTLDHTKTVVEWLIESKLVACANINSNIQSIYRWEGKICYENEVSVILKTTAELVNEAVNQLKALHPYKTPCIIVLPVDSCDKDFSRWIAENVL